MVERVPLKSKSPSTRKRAEVGDGKPSDSTQFSASNQTDHATSGVEALDDTQLDRATKINEEERAYEVKSGADTEFAILPGEEALAFEFLRTKVAEEWAPDGPVEEDLVLTVVKCIWWKQRRQRFIAAKFIAAKYDPDSKAFDEVLSLTSFRQLLEIETEEDEITGSLKELAGYFWYQLTTKCPRKQFSSVAAWVDALKVQIDTVLMPAATRLGDPPRELLIDRSAAVLNDELFARELEFEERIDATLHRALDRLEKIRAAKQRITFLEARRFSKTHPLVLEGFGVVVKSARTQDQKGQKNETR